MGYIGNIPALDYISYAVQNFTVTAGTTVYTLDYSVSNENDIRLVINNVIQRPGASYGYSATGTTLTLTSATNAGDTMYAVFIGRAVQTVVPPANINIQLADGTAAAPSLNFANDTNTGIFRPTTDSLGLTTNGTEAMRIDSSGNVEIYTGKELRVYNAANTRYGTLETTADGTELASHNGSNEPLLLKSPTAGYIASFTNGSERMRIDSGGAVMINTTSNNLGKLNVNGTFYLFSIGSGAGSSTLKYDHVSSGKVTYDTSSRLVKENIENSPYGLNEILQLKPRKYFRKDDLRNEIGLIADEVVDILPEFVPIGQKKLITENEKDIEFIPVSVNYDKLTTVLIKSIQELSAKVDTQQTKIEQLETRITTLENK